MCQRVWLVLYLKSIEPQKSMTMPSLMDPQPACLIWASKGSGWGLNKKTSVPLWYCQYGAVIGEPIKGSSTGIFKTGPHIASQGQLMAHYPAAENCSHPEQNFNYALLKTLTGLKMLQKATHSNQADWLAFHKEDESCDSECSKSGFFSCYILVLWCPRLLYPHGELY